MKNPPRMGALNTVVAIGTASESLNEWADEEAGLEAIQKILDSLDDIIALQDANCDPDVLAGMLRDVKLHELLQLFDRISSSVINPSRAPPGDAISRCRDAIDAISSTGGHKYGREKSELINLLGSSHIQFPAVPLLAQDWNLPGTTRNIHVLRLHEWYIVFESDFPGAILTVSRCFGRTNSRACPEPGPFYRGNLDALGLSVSSGNRGGGHTFLSCRASVIVVGHRYVVILSYSLVLQAVRPDPIQAAYAIAWGRKCCSCAQGPLAKTATSSPPCVSSPSGTVLGKANDLSRMSTRFRSSRGSPGGTFRS
uniref:L27 domain-containing protein n=1 Tax=Anopheles farauti TaxID=69004 RepID=A0A182QG50_9DIPT